MLLQSDRRRVERRLLEVSEAERRRFGREIHSGLGQTLTAIGLLCKAIENRRPGGASPDGALLQEMSENVRRAIQQARGLSILASPPVLRDGKLGASLLLLALDIERAWGGRCSLDAGEHVLLDDRRAAIQLYGIAVDAAYFIQRQCACGTLRFRLDDMGRNLVLSVSGDGGSSDRRSDAEDTCALRLIRCRAKGIGARVEWRQTSAHTTLRCLLRRRS